MKNRVKCDNCQNFIPEILKDENELFTIALVKAKCKLGKRVMFRLPKDLFSDDFGYIRICNDYEKK